MKNILRISLSGLIAVTLTAGVALADEADYTCKKNFLGCYTTYTGPVDVDAAKRYLDDSKAAVKMIADRSDAVETASYMPRKGVLVVLTNGNDRPGFKEVDGFAKLFRDKHLHLKQIVVKTGPSGHIVGGRNVLNTAGGTSRYFSLRNVKFDIDTQITEGRDLGFAKTGVAERNIWGNTTTSF